MIKKITELLFLDIVLLFSFGNCFGMTPSTESFDTKESLFEVVEQFIASEEKDEEAFKKQLEKLVEVGADITQKNKEGNSLLHVIILAGDLCALKCVLELACFRKSSFLYAWDAQGRTPMKLAGEKLCECLKKDIANDSSDGSLAKYKEIMKVLTSAKYGVIWDDVVEFGWKI